MRFEVWVFAVQSCRCVMAAFLLLFVFIEIERVVKKVIAANRRVDAEVRTLLVTRWD
jgi:hypothetical protein